MLVNTEGIVLKKVAYSSSSAIVTVYTRRFGQTPFMVRGLGKKGGKSAAVLPLSRIEIGCKYREKNQVQSLYSLALKHGANWNMHPLKSTISLFLAEMLYKSLREESPDEDLYDFLDAALEFFDRDQFNPNFHLILLMKLSRFLGFAPSGSTEENKQWFDLLNGRFTSDPNASLHMLEPGSTQAFFKLTTSGFSSNLCFSAALRRQLLNAIVEYYQLHLEGIGEIKSLPVLIEIFSGHSDNLT